MLGGGGLVHAAEFFVERVDVFLWEKNEDDGLSEDSDERYERWFVVVFEYSV